MTSKDAVSFHGGTSGSNPACSAGESNSRVNFATCRKDVGVRDDGVPGPAHALRSHCEGNVPRSRLYAPRGTDTSKRTEVGLLQNHHCPGGHWGD